MCTYNTPFNTVGIGDPVPYGMNSLGSGDRFDLGPKFKQKLPKGRSFSQYNYKPARMTFKPPKPMRMPGFPGGMRMPRFGAMPPPPPPPPPLPLPRMTATPFMKRSATPVGKTTGLKPKPLLVMATKKRKKKK